jgi:NADH-quinone oxidoreductase subunit N
MNALLLTAIFGVIMMFSSFLLQSKAAIRGLAITGLIIVVIANILEMSGTVFL